MVRKEEGEEEQEEQEQNEEEEELNNVDQLESEAPVPTSVTVADI